MRFWNRRERVITDSGRVRATQPSARTNRSFDKVEGRRAFDSWIAPTEPTSTPPVDAMLGQDVAPSDTTRGGRDEVSGVVRRTGVPPYAITNLTKDRTYDANATSLAELADIIGTFIRDVQNALREVDRRLKDAGA